MPLDFRVGEVALIETCGAEEALELADWLAKCVQPKVDLGGCQHLHAALLQTLLAYRPEISVEPRDAFLARWVAPLLAPAEDTLPDIPR